MNNLVIFYDGWCPICKHVKKNLQKFDWFKNISFISIRDPITFDIPIEKLVSEMHCINEKNGKVFVGLDAFIQICIRIPIFFPLWLPLKILSIFKIGHKIYKYFADKRTIIPVNNCDDNCSIRTSKERTNNNI